MENRRASAGADQIGTALNSRRHDKNSARIKYGIIAGGFVCLAIALLAILLFYYISKSAKLTRSRPTDLDVKNGLPHASSFCYDDISCDPSTWPGICVTGKQQSPIDILTLGSSFPLYGIQEKGAFHMNEKYKIKVLHEFYAQNNGHTVQLELTPDTAALVSDLVIWGGGLTDYYIFAQLHFHWAEEDWDGSEHTLNGKRFPLELHIVHYKAKYATFAEALASTGDREAIAVMAVFFHIDPKDDAILNPIIEALSYLELPGNVTEFHLDINIGSLYPAYAQTSFARYLGSLTTPTCNEIVIWTIFLESIGISEEQMVAFRHLRNDEGVSDYNYRPVQPLNERKVELYSITEIVL